MSSQHRYNSSIFCSVVGLLLMELFPKFVKQSVVLELVNHNICHIVLKFSQQKRESETYNDINKFKLILVPHLFFYFYFCNKQIIQSMKSLFLFCTFLISITPAPQTLFQIPASRQCILETSAN